MTSIREAMLRTAPPWLQDGDGARLLFTMGTMLDADLEWTRHGIKARFPSYGTDDALAACGRARGPILRGAFEDAETYAGRLRRWLDEWPAAGNPFAIMRQLQAYLAPHEVTFRIVNNGGSWYTLNPDGSREYVLNQANWDWDSETREPEVVSFWSRFWVIIYPPSTLWERLPDWGDPTLWGGAWGTDGYTWGSTATPEQVASVRQIVSQWKDAKSRCMNIIVSFDPALFDPLDATPPNPDGWWQNATRVVGGVRQFTRSRDAIYWSGTGGPVYDGI